LARPLKEGGLNIRRPKEVNKAGMVKLIWKLITDKQSLWVRWIHSRYIKDNNF
jgi:hypothetical protein